MANFSMIQKVGIDNPKAQEIKSLFEGHIRICDLIRETKRDIENQVLLFFSVLMSTAIGAFIATNNWLLVFLCLNLLIFFIIFAVRKQKRDNKFLWTQHNILEKELDKYGYVLTQADNNGFFNLR